MKTMSFDRGLSIGLFALSSWTLYMSITMHRTALRQIVGSEVFPAILSVCIMVASVALFFHSKHLQKGSVSEKLPEGVEREDRHTQALVLLGIGVYIFAMQPLGYLISTTLVCLYEMAILEPGHWVRNILSSVGFSVLVYATFVNFLDILLPVGLLGW